jgi:hypothetical protein
MPKTSEMRESKFLKQSDVGNGVLWTIHGVERVNVAKEGAEPEYKWAMSFAESDTDEWTNKRIVLYTDPNVSYGGKVVGGIRVRAPKKTAAAAPPPPAQVAEELTDDDIPF